MRAPVILTEGQRFASPTLSKPLDQAVWQTWLAKNRAEERRHTARRMKLLTVIGLTLLLVLTLWQLIRSSRHSNLLFSAAQNATVVETNFGTGK